MPETLINYTTAFFEKIFSYAKLKRNLRASFKAPYLSLQKNEARNEKNHRNQAFKVTD